jgi:hypothetical protein
MRRISQIHDDLLKIRVDFWGTTKQGSKLSWGGKLADIPTLKNSFLSVLHLHEQGNESSHICVAASCLFMFVMPNENLWVIHAF